MASLSRDYSVNVVLAEKSNPDGVFKTLDELYKRKEVQCVQCVNETTWCVTLTSAEAANRLTTTGMVINQKTATVTPAGRKVTFVNIFNAPHEMDDTAVSSKLSYFGTILSNRRGHWQSHPEWENGVRHYRMELCHTIPSFIKIGQFSLHVKYDGQPKTCRKCNGPGHMAAECPFDTCYNCGLQGHRANMCPNPPKCKICGEDHITRDCPKSYRNSTRRPPSTMTFPPAAPQHSESDFSASEQVEETPTVAAEKEYPQLTDSSDDGSATQRPRRVPTKLNRTTPVKTTPPKPKRTTKNPTTEKTMITTKDTTPTDWADRSENPPGEDSDIDSDSGGSTVSMASCKRGRSSSGPPTEDGEFSVVKKKKKRPKKKPSE